MGLILHLPLNSDVRDIGPYGKSASTTGTITYTSGKMGNASTWSSAYAIYSGFTAGTNLTFATWAKTNSTPSSMSSMLFTFECSASGGMNIWFYNNKIYLNISDGIGNPFRNGETDVTIPASGWHHYAIRFAGSNNAQLYIDGQYKGTAITYRNPTMSNKRIAVGAYISGSYNWNGQIQDFRVYDESLSPKRIAKLAQGLAARWTLDGLNMGNKRIPNEYQRVEYLESTGTQYFDTQIVPNETIHIKMRVAHNESIIDTPVFGSRRSDMSNSYTLWSHPIGYDNSGGAIFNGHQKNFTTKYAVGCAIDIDYSQQGIHYNEQFDTFTKTYGTPELSLILLGLRNGGSIDSRRFAGKLWYCNIWLNGHPVCDFLPCYRKSDGKPGLYDTITNTFFTNAGSGEFLLGPSIGLPADYQQIEYIEHVNNTQQQYIVTNSNWNIVKKTQFIMMPVKLSANNQMMILSNNSWNACWVSRNNSAWQNGANFSGLTYSPSAIPAMGVCTNVTISGFNTSTTSKLQFGSWSDVTWSGTWRNYCARIYGSSAVLEDYVPCYRKSDCAIGMYDVINNVFRVNGGTGILTAGPAVGVAEGYTQLDYIQFNKGFYFDTGYKAPANTNYDLLLSNDNYTDDTKIFGSYGQSNSRGLCIGSLNTKWRLGGSSWEFNTPTITNAITNVLVKNRQFFINGVSAGTSSTVGAITSNLAIGAIYYQGSIYEHQAGKVQSMRFSEPMVIHDYVAAVRNSDNVIGFYDIVTGQFLTKTGSGTITAGNRKGFTAFVSPSAGNEFDVSGNAMNATVSGSLGTSGYSPVQYGGPGPFSTANCIDAGTKAKLPAPITINVWAKSRDWASEKGAMISCTDSGGWNINGTDVANNQSFLMYINGSYKIISYANSNITAGWHMFTMSYDGAVMRAYFDGVQIGTSSISSTLGYNANNHLFIGAEASSTSPGNPTFNGYISDLRVYATALSADAIAELYNCSRK